MLQPDDHEWRRFFAVQRIIVLSLSIVAIVVAAVVFLPQQEDSDVSLLQPAVETRDDAGGLFGNIKITADGGFSLAYAKVLVNGLAMGDFAEGEVLLRVYPWDAVSIDGRAYQRELTFHITSLSANISKDYVTTNPVTNGDIADVGIIVFK